MPTILLGVLHILSIWADSVEPAVGLSGALLLGPTGTLLYGEYAVLPFLKAVH